MIDREEPPTSQAYARRTAADAPTPRAREALPDGRQKRTDYVWAALLVGVATGIGRLGRGYMAQSDVAMLYLVTIGLAATRFGRGPSLLASALSVASYNFFFVPPFYTLAVSDLSHVLTFSMMFGAGLLLSALRRRIRRQELSARTEEIRSSLLSAVSHDLRTPLATITGAATTLRDPTAELSPAQRAELLDSICDEADRLERLVRNLLEMTRLDSGIDLRREWVPLEEIIGGALTRLEGKLAGRPVTIDLPRDLPLVSVDPLLLEQLFLNLLDNADKHAHGSSPIEIRARAGEGGVVVEVRDRGPGFPRGTEPRVFEKFFRAAQDTRGAGLGLAIVKGIAEAHGGTIAAENREGGGAVLRLRLPFVGTPPVVQRAS